MDMLIMLNDKTMKAIEKREFILVVKCDILSAISVFWQNLV